MGVNPVAHRARRLSGLQKDVLNLYRDFLRAISAKDAAAQPGLRSYVREHFKAQLPLKTTQVTLIEHHLRSGRKKLEQLQSPQFRGLSIVSQGDEASRARVGHARWSDARRRVDTEVGSGKAGANPGVEPNPR